MSDFVTGYVTGTAVGLACGVAIGSRQKPLSELTEREKKIRMGIIIALALVVVAGVVAFFLIR